MQGRSRLARPDAEEHRKDKELIAGPKDRPKAIWFVCLLFIFISSQYFRVGEYYLASGTDGKQDLFYQLFALGFLATLGLMLRGIVILKPLAIRTAIVVFLATALLGVYQFIVLLLHGRFYFGILAIRVIPTSLAAWYLARPSFLALCEAYTKFREQDAMTRHILKQLSKR